MEHRQVAVVHAVAPHLRSEPSAVSEAFEPNIVFATQMLRQGTAIAGLGLRVSGHESSALVAVILKDERDAPGAVVAVAAVNLPSLVPVKGLDDVHLPAAGVEVFFDRPVPLEGEVFWVAFLFTGKTSVVTSAKTPFFGLRSSNKIELETLKPGAPLKADLKPFEEQVARPQLHLIYKIANRS